MSATSDTPAPDSGRPGTAPGTGWKSVARRWRRRLFPWSITAVAVGLAGALGNTAWRQYVETPWTRDGSVRAYVVTVAPEVAGRIVDLRVRDNQFVHKGDLIMVIDPRDYRIAVSRDTAALQKAKLDAENLFVEASRRDRLARLDAVAAEQAENYDNNALIARAQVTQAEAALRQAQVNLQRTEIRAPVEGWVTNLLAQRDDFAAVGRNEISVINADSFWIDAYFEETKLAAVCDGDRAHIQLMGYSENLDGHVDSIARGIDVTNAQPNQQGLATVNPIYTWVRLAQRVPVRIQIDHVPANVRLIAGMTATVRILTGSDRPSPRSAAQRPCPTGAGALAQRIAESVGSR